MQKKPHLSPWWSSRTKTGHNPAPQEATVGLIHLTFTSIQMRPTAYALGDAVIKSDFLKYSTTCIVAGAAKQDETGWKGERAILSLHWPCLNARCEMRSSGLTPSFLPRPGITIIKKGKKKCSQKQPPWQQCSIILSVCYTNVPQGHNKTMLTWTHSVSHCQRP